MGESKCFKCLRMQRYLQEEQNKRKKERRSQRNRCRKVREREKEGVEKEEQRGREKERNVERSPSMTLIKLNKVNKLFSIGHHRNHKLHTKMGYALAHGFSVTWNKSKD